MEVQRAWVFDKMTDPEVRLHRSLSIVGRRGKGREEEGGI